MNRYYVVYQNEADEVKGFLTSGYYESQADLVDFVFAHPNHKVLYTFKIKEK